MAGTVQGKRETLERILFRNELEGLELRAVLEHELELLAIRRAQTVFEVERELDPSGPTLEQLVQAGRYGQEDAQDE